MSKDPITIVSTYANDILLNNDQEILARQPGGPAMFIENALQNADVPYVLQAGKRVDMEILMVGGEEFGRLPQRPDRLSLDEVNLTEWTIVSTLLNEWDIAAIAKVPARLFIDLHGFVRDGNDFGKKVQWSADKRFTDTVYCIKGTEEELEYVPDEVREKQKERLLVITKGADGADIYYKNKMTHVPAQVVKNPVDTIGAGDTFLGYFVAAMYGGSDPVVAAEYAASKTALFLGQKATS